ncbi:hypothetical protein C8N47_10481 [Mangrovibacterium marinum]|uniref:Uncharacterized protein n=1 Tax=Mangrovibacterium marinum TaxID=1639118 RepID=A0A2T5C414_9BACT|nr:hypothetical protein C8N47_10481 [Mangrovibacterium marinum]
MEIVVFFRGFVNVIPFEYPNTLALGLHAR